MRAALVAVLLVILTTQPAIGRYISRPKRVSDQRLAEIETLLALSRYNGLLTTAQVGFNRLDPNAVGRRRRASPLLWRDLMVEDEDVSDMNEADEAGAGREEEEEKRGVSEYKLVKERRRFAPE